MAEPVTRVGGRLLLVDPDDRVLLIHERLEHGSSHWLTPGGGLEDGEAPAAAAVREGYEEVGLQVPLAPDAHPVHETRRIWSWGSISYDQTDYFFLVRVPAGLVLTPGRLTPVEALNWLGFGWWTAAQLRATEEVVVPPDLGAVLDRCLRARR